MDWRVAGVTLLPLALFAFVTSITPGPNNLMIAASGASWGMRRTLPHLLGINLGFTVLLVAVCAGLGSLFLQWPVLQTALKAFGCGYMFYLAWRLWQAGGVGESGTRGRPLAVWEAALFQFVNPKAWMMAIGCVSAFLPPQADALVLGAVVLAVVFSVVNLPCVGSWAAFGTAMRHFLHRPFALRVFNGAMAMLTAATGVGMWW